MNEWQRIISEFRMQQNIKWKQMGESDFGWAIRWIKSGRRVTRLGWNGRGMWLEIQTPEENSKMGMPYIYISLPCGKLLPWTASQTDMLAMDWCFA